MSNKELLGQISIFDVLASVTDAEPVKAGKKASKKSQQKDEKDVTESDYLKVGEKIISLLREKKTNTSRVLKKNPVMDTFSLKRYEELEISAKRLEYLEKQVEKKIINPVLDSLQNEDGTYDFTPFADLFLEFSNIINVSLMKENSYEYRLMEAFFYKKSLAGMFKDGIEVVVKGDNVLEGEKLIAPLCNKTVIPKRNNGASYWLKSCPEERRRCVNIGSWFSQPILFLMLRDMVQKVIKKERENNTLNECPLYCFLQRKALERVLGGSDEIIPVYDRVEEFECVRSFLKENNIPYHVVSRADKRHDTPVRNFTDFFYVFMLAEKLDPDVVSYMVYHRRYWSKEICNVFEHIYEIYSDEEKEEEYEKSLRSDYALSYQTKKTISDKVVNAMEKSEFNEWFGYVEFDNECDLDKLEGLYKEFEALAKKLKLEKHDLVSLRFRKLGHHHAAGLYYPAFKCICVDVRYPSSMAHEYFHMLDYENGKLSKRENFHEIKELYKKCVKEYINKNASSEVKKKFEGNSKYNASYYFQPTEIFARCGEMYLTDVLEIDNSLVEPDGGFAYPKSERLKELIKNYFDGFFGE